MKKFFTFLIVAALSLTTNLYAQSEDTKFLIGAGLNYATDISNIGLSVDGTYLINEDWEAAAGFTYFFEKNLVNWSMLDFDGHYVFHNNNGLTAYGLAGLNVTFWKIKWENVYGDEYGDLWSGVLDDVSKGSDVGLNLGAGIRYGLSDKLLFTGEAKYTVSSGGFLTLTAGVAYCF
ncbi:MAG: outer membrane beta-barrel protein [Draconibacterium sp.]